jgi:hypothetical protein
MADSVSLTLLTTGTGVTSCNLDYRMESLVIAMSVRWFHRRTCGANSSWALTGTEGTV